MVSRKKNKGKERKAKKEEIKKAERRSRWERFARGEDENNRKVIHCDHGCTVEIPDVLDHPVVCFMDKFSTRRDHWIDVIKSHLHVWKSNDNRKMVIDLLLSLGTNSLLRGISTSADAANIDIVCTIVVLEHYKETMSVGEVYYSRGVGAKVRDIHGGNMRDVLKFYSKRTSCPCLKKMYSDARKTLPKVGRCYHCDEVKERELLSVCSRCRIHHYCSRECQVAGWSMHEKFCDGFFRVHKQQTK